MDDPQLVLLVMVIALGIAFTAVSCVAAVLYIQDRIQTRRDLVRAMLHGEARP